MSRRTNAQKSWRTVVGVLLMFVLALAVAVIVGNRISVKFEENVLRGQFVTEFGVSPDDRSPQAQEVVRDKIAFLCRSMLEASHRASEHEKNSGPAPITREVLGAQERFMEAFSLAAQVNYPDNFDGCTRPADEEK